MSEKIAVIKKGIDLRIGMSEIFMPEKLFF